MATSRDRDRAALERRARRLEELSTAPRQIPITFSIVGVQKAATSSLYRMLTRHPRVAGGPEKELQYFARERLWPDADLSDYKRPAKSPEQDVAGDATPVYLIWPRALERMRDYRSDMRLIACFRDPVERAFSHWAMDRGRHGPVMPDISDALETFELRRIPEEVPPDLSARAFRRSMLFTRGLYGQQLERGLQVFPPEQWLMLDFRRIIGDHPAVLDECTDHLGLERFKTYPRLAHVNKSQERHTGKAPTGDDIKRLAEVYADDLERFERLSGLDVSDWPTRRVIVGSLDPEEFAEKLGRKLGLR